MTSKETRTFMDRIKSHYQEFIIDDFKISEWYGKLKDYDIEDINKKFDEHLNSEEYGDKIPRIGFLTRYLTKSADKGKIRHYTVICQNCGCEVSDIEYDNHFKKCNAIRTIITDMKKYFNLDISEEQLNNLSDIKFEEMYERYLNKMLDADISITRKRIILKCIYPNNEVDIDKVLASILEEKNEKEEVRY